MTVPDLATIAILVVALWVAHGANARIARLITEDEVTIFWRKWFAGLADPKTKTKITFFRSHQNLHRWLNKWAGCPWCAGWWTAWPIAAVAWFPIMGSHLWGLSILAALSIAHGAGRLNHNHGS